MKPSLSMPPVINQIVEHLINQVPCIQKIILYGSRARGDNEARSDIDLAVDCPMATPQDWSKIEQVIEDAHTLLKVEVVRLETAPGKLKDNILKEGVILYER